MYISYMDLSSTIILPTERESMTYGRKVPTRQYMGVNPP